MTTGKIRIEQLWDVYTAECKGEAQHYEPVFTSGTRDMRTEILAWAIDNSARVVSPPINPIPDNCNIWAVKLQWFWNQPKVIMFECKAMDVVKW